MTTINVTIPTQSLSVSMHIHNMVKICPFVLEILSRHKILALIKDHNSGIDEQRMTCTDPSLDLVNIKAYIWERSGSVVECFTRDREAAGSSLTGVIAVFEQDSFILA